MGAISRVHPLHDLSNHTKAEGKSSQNTVDYAFKTMEETENQSKKAFIARNP